MCTMCSAMNYWAILVAALVYWLLGSIWFSVFFKKSWSHEVGKTGIKIKKPSSGEMRNKFITTFLLKLVQVWGLAVILSGFGVVALQPAIRIGLLIGICFAATTISVKALWENNSFKLVCIDAGYPIVGLVVSAIILALWQ
jgi:hypothetical protein